MRKPLKKADEDPFGDKPSEDLSKKTLDQILVGDDVQAAAMLHGAIEDFARELAYVTGRFLKTKAWDKTEAIVVGGGFKQRRMGQLAIARRKHHPEGRRREGRDDADPSSPPMKLG